MKVSQMYFKSVEALEIASCIKNYVAADENEVVCS
jgi:hypothetical protein